jgi:hypothetical protein
MIIEFIGIWLTWVGDGLSKIKDVSRIDEYDRKY